MDYDRFKNIDVIRELNYSWEAVSDGRMWESALDAITCLKKKIELMDMEW
jgi:hypothetical protein